ncbi:MAG: hypothetical protein K6F25_00510 [Bacteroidales bacterium]|nr:hypothetical protein [Bacteroidales bacterium]
MKYIFIAYADEKMAYSLRRIGRQARRLGYFDEVLLYTPDTLPEYIRSSELLKHPYGGGYWAWKPAIIWETLQRHDDGDAVCYVDAGCTLNACSEWRMYLELIRKYDDIVFAYPDEMPQWEKYGTVSTRIKHWTKKIAVDLYDTLTGGTEWRECNKVLGGFIWAKGKDNPLVREWLDIVLEHPEVIDDSTVFDEQYPFFVRHKHDQPALTALSYKYKERCLVLPELLDEGPKDAAVVADRVKVKSFPQYLLWSMKKTIRLAFGQEFVARLKKLLHK